MEKTCKNCVYFNPDMRECIPVRDRRAARKTTKVGNRYPSGIDPRVSELHTCDAYLVDTQLAPDGRIVITFGKNLLFTPRS